MLGKGHCSECGAAVVDRRGFVTGRWRNERKETRGCTLCALHGVSVRATDGRQGMARWHNGTMARCLTRIMNMSQPYIQNFKRISDIVFKNMAPFHASETASAHRAVRTAPITSQPVTRTVPKSTHARPQSAHPLATRAYRAKSPESHRKCANHFSHIGVATPPGTTLRPKPYAAVTAHPAVYITAMPPGCGGVLPRR